MPEAGIDAVSGPCTRDAHLVAAMVCVDPVGLGGVALRAAAGEARDAWLALTRSLMPHGAPWRRVPLHVQEDRLLGGLDLAATLSAGRPVLQRGLLAESDGGTVVLCMAQRVEAGAAARMAAVLDTRSVRTLRDGVSAESDCRIAVIALDEGASDDEAVATVLLDRLAFHLSLAERSPCDARGERASTAWTSADVHAARSMLAAVNCDAAALRSLCAASLALGVDSLRAPLFALRAAHACAALHGRLEVQDEDIAAAARLVLLPRATAVLEDEREEQAEPAATPADTPSDHATDSAEADTAPDESSASRAALEDTVADSAVAAVPRGLLDALKAEQAARGALRAGGRAGAVLPGRLRGRPIGAHRGAPVAGARLNLIETLRAAAPWQPLRRRDGGAGPHASQVRVRREDFRVTRFQTRSETTTVFVVDASGSTALHRLAEAKGAIELLLADCYARRDSVALIAFRGRAAELLLPPTRSLTRAKRCLAALPGGGGTPLAAAIDAASTLAGAIARRGAMPVTVLLTDGRANVGRDGAPGRERAVGDAMQSASRWRVGGSTALLLDTSPTPQASARALADAMGAAYVPLPHADAARLSGIVRATSLAAPRADARR